MVDYVLNADLRLKKSTKRKPCLATTFFNIQFGKHVGTVKLMTYNRDKSHVVFKRTN